MATNTWELFFKFHHLTGLLLVAGTLVVATFYRRHDISFWNVDEKKTTTKCDFFSGKWIYDHHNMLSPSSYYKEEQCSFMDPAFSCHKNGRKEFRYRNWRWQPHQCNISRFNGKEFLEKIRGKKMIFVGDSLNRNQWVSLLCLVEPYLPQLSNKTLTLIGNFKYLHNIEYNVTIGFYWSPFLVESNCDSYSHHYRINNHTVRIEAIEKHARHWNDADLLVFNSHSWWLKPKMTLLWGSFGSPDATYKEVEMKTRVYEMALRTWFDWVIMNLNRTKTKMFFMGATPSIRRDVWGHCYNKNEPISELQIARLNQSMMDEEPEWDMMDEALKSTIEKVRRRGIQIEYLGITKMSLYRQDAHPSIYWSYPASHPEQAKAIPLNLSDCLHWCLPGVPDVWNQILYDYIMKS